MSDAGISITGLTIGGAALTAIGGMVGAWLRARYGRTEITPQPLPVRDETDRALQEHMEHNRGDHSNMFSRISNTEQRISALEAQAVAQGRQLERIDHKLDRVLEKLR